MLIGIISLLLIFIILIYVREILKNQKTLKN